MRFSGSDLCASVGTWTFTEQVVWGLLTSNKDLQGLNLPLEGSMYILVVEEFEENCTCVFDCSTCCTCHT